MARNKRETNYRNLENRCPNCGHRRGVMHDKAGCMVVSGPPPEENNCRCHNPNGSR